MRHLSLLALALLCTTAVAQTTYRWVDPATGKTMITDTPPPGKVKQVEKERGNSNDDGPISFAARQAAERFPVTLYTAPNCTDQCKSARELLNKRGVPFTEKMVQSEADIAELKAATGSASVPVLKVGKQLTKGFSDDSYNNLLDLAGYPNSAPYGAKPNGGLSR